MCNECKKDDYKSQLSGKTKICKCCGIEKPVEEFGKQSSNSYYKNCKVCRFINKYNIIPIEGWNINEYKIVLDCILNKKIETINEIVPLLNNKTLFDLADLLSYNLKIRNMDIKLKVKCQYEGCGKYFKTTINRYKNNKFKYCSPECSQKSQKNKIVYKCDNCRRQCETTPSSYKKSENHFCSHECADIFNAKKRRNRVNLVCNYCGKEILITKTKYNRNQSKIFYCNKECKFNFNKVNVKCENCGKEIIISKSYYNKNKFKKFYCTKECEHENKTITFNCDYCEKQKIITKKEFNKNKHHFCCYECSVKYKNKK